MCDDTMRCQKSRHVATREEAGEAKCYNEIRRYATTDNYNIKRHQERSEIKGNYVR